jgi:hypothetical protein
MLHQCSWDAFECTGVGTRHPRIARLPSHFTRTAYACSVRNYVMYRTHAESGCSTKRHGSAASLRPLQQSTFPRCFSQGRRALSLEVRSSSHVLRDVWEAPCCNFLWKATVQANVVLYVTLSETKAELEFAFRSHDWSPDGIAVAPALPSTSTWPLGRPLTRISSRPVASVRKRGESRDACTMTIITYRPVQKYLECRQADTL